MKHSGKAAALSLWLAIVSACPPGLHAAREMVFVEGGTFPDANPKTSGQLVIKGDGIVSKFDPTDGNTNNRFYRVPDSEFSGTQVGSFLISACEVTWREWRAVTDWALENGYTDLAEAGMGNSPDVPVDVAHQFDAMKWCNAKSEKEGLSPVYRVDGKIYRKGRTEPDADAAADGYRLPTGAEWEWAARGGIRSKGFVFSGGNKLDDVGWWRGNSIGAPQNSDGVGRGIWPVGRKAPNELGLHDMSGNVWEWCAESIRGGGWAGSDDFCTVGSSMTPEIYYDPDDYFPSPGLRVARNAPQQPSADHAEETAEADSEDKYGDVEFDYTARISNVDMRNSKGQFLPDLRGIKASDILLQERFNFHDRSNRDPEDTWDLTVAVDPKDGSFSSPAALARLRELFDGKKVVQLVDSDCDRTGKHGPGCRHADQMDPDDFDEVSADFFRSQPVVRVDTNCELGVIVLELVTRESTDE